MIKKAFVLIIVWSISSIGFADTIFLKSGQKVSGKIFEKTNEKVRVEVGGAALTYWPDNIDHVSVEGEVAARPQEETENVFDEEATKLYQQAFEQIKEPPAKGDFQTNKILLDIKKSGWQDDARVISLLNENKEAMDLFKKATQQYSDGYILGKVQNDLNPTKNLMGDYFKYLGLLNLDLIEANKFLFQGDYSSAQESLLAAVNFIKHFAQQKEGGSLNSVFAGIAEIKTEQVVITSLEKNSLGRAYYQELLKALLAFPNEQELAENWLLGDNRVSLNTVKYDLNKAQEKRIVDSQFVYEFIATYERESKKILDYKMQAIKTKNPVIFSSNVKEVFGDMNKQKDSECKMTRNEDYLLTDEAVVCWMKYIQEIGIDNEIKQQLARSILQGGKIVEGFYWPIEIRNNWITALAVKLYQIDNGSLPSKLDDLVPQYLAKAPEDAFDNFKPIKYVQKANGYLVYSIGPDHVDQKGDVVCDFVGGPQACDISVFVKQ